jgi:excisionase family DNA binding protein
MTIPILYTPEELAEKLKVTRRSVYAWLLNGRLRGLRAGDTWRITEQDLMAFLESRGTAKQAIGARHPDYQRWWAYFKRQGLGTKGPARRNEKRKTNVSQRSGE